MTPEHTLELDELEGIRLKPGQCPGCWSDDTVALVVEPRRESVRGFHEGKEYSLAETVKYQCNRCGVTFTKRSYH